MVSRIVQLLRNDTEYPLAQLPFKAIEHGQDDNQYRGAQRQAEHRNRADEGDETAPSPRDCVTQTKKQRKRHMHGALEHST